MLQLFGAKNVSSLTILAQSLKHTHNLDVLPHIDYTDLGKPFFPTMKNLHFNISHSGDYILCAISSCCVGVDIECVKTRKPQLPQYALTKEEYTQYLALGGNWNAFYKLWTKKEAFVKYTGKSILSFREQMDSNELLFTHYTGDDFEACLCSSEPAPSSITWLAS